MKVVRNYIEYYGIADFIPCEVLGFNDSITEEVVELINKPEIGYFNKCEARPVVESKRTICLENNKHKVNIEGHVYIRVEYVSLEYDGLICTDRKKIYFNMDVDILDKFNQYKKSIANVFIEDIYLKKLNEQKYLISLSILGIVEE